MRTLVVLLAVWALGCTCRRDAPRGGQSTTVGIPRAKLTAGADLVGPLPAPRSEESRPRRDAKMLDLGSDRPVVEVELPAPPPGGAAGFTFAGEMRGWIARIPEGQPVPAPAYGDGRIYVSGGFGSVSYYALDAESGRIVWSTTRLEDNGPTAAVFEDGRILFNTESCTLFVVEAATGKKIWHKWLGDPTLAQVATAGGLVFAQHPGPSGPTLSAYRVKDGEQVWSRSVDGELLATPVIHGDSVYASTLAGTTFRFRRADGALAWRKKLGATTAPWLAGEELFVARRSGDREAQVVASAKTGEILRTHDSLPAPYLGEVPKDLSNWPQVWAFEGSRPVVAEGIRYVAMGNDVRASDARTGTLLWARRDAHGVSSRSTSTVAVAGPQVVVSTRKGEVFGLDIDTGYTLWAYGIGKPVAAQPVVAKGWVVLATQDGHVVGLRVGDASLDGWHMFGGNPEHNGPATTRSAG